MNKILRPFYILSVIVILVSAFIYLDFQTQDSGFAALRLEPNFFGATLALLSMPILVVNMLVYTKNKKLAWVVLAMVFVLDLVLSITRAFLDFSILSTIV